MRALYFVSAVGASASDVTVRSPPEYLGQRGENTTSRCQLRILKDCVYFEFIGQAHRTYRPLLFIETLWLMASCQFRTWLAPLWFLVHG